MSVTSTSAPTRSASIAGVVGFLVFCEFTSGFTQSYYSPLIAAIAKHYSVSAANATWFATVFTLAAAVCVPLLSKVGDMYGHRRILRIATVVVFVATIVTAFAPTYWLLLAGRIVSAPIAVWLPLEIAIIHSRSTGATARKAIGFLAATLAVGAIAGPIVAGVLGSVSSALWVAMVAPAALIAVAGVFVFTKVPESVDRAPGKVDGIGFAALAVGLVALLWGLQMVGTAGIASPSAYLSLVLAAIVMTFFIWWELRVQTPVIDLRLVVSKALGPLYTISFSYGFVAYGSLVPLTLFLAANPEEVGYGFAAQPGMLAAIGAAFALLACIGAVAATFMGARLKARTVLLFGTVLVAIGVTSLALLHQSLWQIWVSVVVTGLAFGLLTGALPGYLAERAPSDAKATASGVYNAIRAIAGSIAGAASAVMLNLFISSTGATAATGYVLLWSVSAGLMVVAIIAVFFVGANPKTETVPGTRDAAPIRKGGRRIA